GPADPRVTNFLAHFTRPQAPLVGVRLLSVGTERYASHFGGHRRPAPPKYVPKRWLIRPLRRPYVRRRVCIALQRGHLREGTPQKFASKKRWRVKERTYRGVRRVFAFWRQCCAMPQFVWRVTRQAVLSTFEARFQSWP